MEETEWICPICGCDEYTEYYYDNEDGSKLLMKEDAEVSHCECANCSVQFGDPNKFLAQNIFSEEIINEANDIIRQVIGGNIQ